MANRLHDKATIKPYLLCFEIYLCSGFVPDRESLIVHEDEADVFQDVERGPVNLVELWGGEDFLRPQQTP